MKSAIQPEPLVVEEFELGAWPGPRHLRHHFELISIRQGSGAYLVNDQHLRYRTGNLFLLAPAARYSFAIDQPTSFGVLRFTEAYLTGLTTSGRHTGAWQLLRDYTLHAALGLPGCITLEPAEQQQVEALLTILFTEHDKPGQPFNDTLAESLLGAVLSFVGRRLPDCLPGSWPAATYAGNLVQRVLRYIQRHISQPDCLRVERLASEFAYSPKHLSAVFKQETGESLRQYILRYKLKLAETLLLRSTRTVSQIADELAFTDVCHLNKLFKKHYDTTPTDYRRLLTTQALVSA
ncbi:AraC family transcriptional regulator [Hymenobacter cellulosivorans]|uniref:AraC family transcriptional regulator n=1 Tax=Hymenobacter cellulosivorans TaxID=2932249 RepID=A0ABY4F6P6_9BACT|nr:AraC family transcriptional regulator [Hymenobacter cellulosivorans]UOQ52245.1 AraC family transcriptional regulator [Hymenobacter cellulosivorans]